MQKKLCSLYQLSPFYITVTICCLLQITPFSSQSQTNAEKGLPFITNYTPKTFKALPQVWSVIEDESGIMYFGVQNYVLEYDGVKWRKIIFKDSTGAPRGSVVRSMTKNNNGTIYYGGFSDLGYLDNDSLGQKRTNSLLKLVPGANRNFLDMWTTYATESGIYFQSREYIFRYDDKARGANKKRMMKVWVPKTKFMYAFYLDGNYYVHQQGLGLYKMINDSLVLVPGSEFLGKERMQVMLPYKSATGEKQYLIGMFYSGLYLYDGKTFRPFKTEADPVIKTGSILYKGTLLNNGSYVLSTTGKGLVIIDAQGKLQQRINREVGLQDESIYAVYQDKKGTLWLGLDNGISRVETASPLSRFGLQSGINTGVLFAKRFEGNLFVGTSNGLLKFNNKNGMFNPVPGIDLNQVFSLLPDGKEILVPGDGLYAIKDNKTITIRKSVSADLSLTGLYISKKYPDILLGGGTFGITIFTRTSGKNNSDEKGPWVFAGYVPGMTDQIWTFSENTDGSIWAGTQAGSVYLVNLSFDEKGIINVQKTKFEKLGAEQGLKNGLGQVYSIKGINYFIGDSTLYTFNDKVNRFKPDSTFGVFKKAGGNTEFDIIQDQQGRVWIRFGKETRLAIPKPEGGYRFDSTQLSSISELTIQKIYPESNGIVWVCATDGLIRYDENLEKNTEQSFKTVIRSVSAGKNLLSTIIDKDTKSVSVSYKDNTLRFEYAAPFFEQEEKTEYQTRLEGFEKDWSELANNYYKEYTNLPAGKYTFHVRAENIYKKLSEEAVYSFEILPPWYLTWWAYLLYGIVLVGSIYFIIHRRTQKLKEQHRELEKIVAERTHEISQRVEELGVINTVQDGLVREMDIQGIYNLVGEKIREIFNAQVIDIVTYNKKTNLIEDRYAYKKGDRSLLGTREPQGFRKQLIENKQLILLNKDIEKSYVGYDNKILIDSLPKSAVFVPMISAGEVVGIISLQDLDKEHAFTEADVSLVTTLANSMSVALESARRFDETNRLLKETEQRTAELAVINSVQDGLAKELDMQSIYNLVGDRVQELFNAQVVLIATFDLENKFEHFNYSFENGEKVKAESRPINKLRQLLIDKKHSIYIRTEEESINVYGLTPIADTQQPKALLFVPLLTGNIIRGYVSLQNIDKENAFSETDIRLLETLANSMSVALENARLFDETTRLLKETEQRTAELAVINSVQDGLAKELDMQGIYDLVGDRVQHLFHTHAVIIASFDLEKKMEHFNYVFENGEKYKLDSRPLNKLREVLIDKKQTIYIATEDEAKNKYGITAIADTKMPKSLMFVPLLSGNNIKGYVSIQNIDKNNAFSESDIRLLETLANSMSVALENARLFDETNRLLKETEQRTTELAVINSVQEGLVKEVKSQGIYQLVGEKLCELFDTQTVLIRTFDQETGLEIWRYAIEKGQRQYSDPRPLIWANRQLIATHKPILINENYVETAKKYGGSGVSMGHTPKSAVFVPMIVGDTIRGSVSLQNVDKEHAFSEGDVKLLTTITNSMGVALENARLFDETSRLLDESKQRANELGTVNNISQALASHLNLDEIIKLVGDQMKDLFKANIVYLALLNKKTKLIHFPYQYGDVMPPQKLGEGLTSKILKTGKPLLINKDVGATTIELGVNRMGLPAASYLGVPITNGDEIIGVLSVQSTEAENHFNDDNERLLSTIAASVGVALNKAQLFEEVTQAKQQAEYAGKAAEKANEAKSAFLSTVSHELRTPLTSVLGFAKIIRKRLEEKIFPVVDKTDVKIEKTISQISENLQVVISEGERLTHLINDVLDLAKIEAGKMEWSQENVAMAEVAERAIAATTSLFDQKNLQLIRDFETDLPEITGDHDKLIQVVINLISNSVKFTDSGSITCRVHKEKDEVIVSISDTGIGIAPEDFGAVFEQFKQVGGDTLTDKPKGTGLGLPICKEIVEHHGGRIWLESKVGKGSTFSFAIPIVASDAVKEKPILLNELVKQLREQIIFSELKSKGKNATILIVDDEQSIRSLLRQELNEAGYLTEEAANGKEALECIRKNKPDLVILDVMMPEINGFDVAAILKNDPQTMDIPIIVLSIVQDKARGFRIGVDRYLTKPIDTAQLFAEVGTLLEQGKSKKKVMVVDEDSIAIRALTDVLQAKGYTVVESDGKELVEKAIANQPDIIILNSILTDKSEIVQTLRFEKGLENVLFFIYQ